MAPPEHVIGLSVRRMGKVLTLTGGLIEGPSGLIPMPVAATGPTAAIMPLTTETFRTGGTGASGTIPSRTVAPIESILTGETVLPLKATAAGRAGGTI
jgi:hypothetical protein